MGVEGRCPGEMLEAGFGLMFVDELEGQVSVGR